MYCARTFFRKSKKCFFTVVFGDLEGVLKLHSKALHYYGWAWNLPDCFSHKLPNFADFLQISWPYIRYNSIQDISNQCWIKLLTKVSTWNRQPETQHIVFRQNLNTGSLRTLTVVGRDKNGIFRDWTQGCAKPRIFHQKRSPVGLTGLNRVLMGFMG